MRSARWVFDLLRRGAPSPLVWLGVPALLYVWTLGSPFRLDDLHLLRKCERYAAGQTDRLDLFRFAVTETDWQALRDRGVMPWWAPSQGRFAFLRPAAEALFYLDVRLFGRNPVGHNAVSFGWFLFALVMLNRLYRACSGDAVHAGAAAFLFGISQPVCSPVVFPCNRSDLVVVVGAATAVWAYWRAGSRPSRGLVIVAVLGCALALASKEVGLPIVGVLLGHALLERRRGTGPARMQWIIVLALLAVAAAYLAYYQATLGLPQATTAAGTLSARALNAVCSLGVFLTVWTLALPITAFLLWPSGQLWLIAAAGFAAALVVAPRVARTVRGDRAASLFGLWAVLYLLFALLTVAESRALCVATVGWAYLLAGFLLPKDDGRSPIWLRHALLTANGLLSIACVIGAIVYANRIERTERDDLLEAARSRAEPLRPGDALILINVDQGMDSFFAADRLDVTWGTSDVAVHYLIDAGTSATVRREDERTLLLSAPPPGLMASALHRKWTGPHGAPHVGMRWSLRDFEAEVAAVEQGAVTALRFRFREPLTAPRLRFYPPLQSLEQH